MTTFISRDYNPTTTGYTITYATFAYETSLFLYRVLGYSIVGKMGWEIDKVVSSVNITAISDTSPREVTTASPHGLVTGQGVVIAGATPAIAAGGAWTVTVTGPQTFTIDTLNYNGNSYLSGGTVTTGLMISSGLISGSNGAGINFGVGVEKEVSIPSSVRVVSVADVGRILVLKSSAFPTKNSGCFKITGINVGSNRYIIDYRSTENPPVELANSMDWWLYEIENVASGAFVTNTYGSYTIQNATNTSPIVCTTNSHGFMQGQIISITGATGNTAVNGTWTITVLSNTTFSLNGSTGNGTYSLSSGTARPQGYQAGENSSSSRIILQSPHATGWQVRMALEYANTNLSRVSFAVGLGGNSLGNFAIGGQHTHVAQYFNVNPVISTDYTGLSVGGGTTNNAGRCTIMGDDGGQSVFLYVRTLASTNNGFIAFGVPDNEQSPSSVAAERIYCYGSNGYSTSSQDFRGIQLRMGTNSNVGLAFKNGKPDICSLSGWANLEGTPTITAPTFTSSAADSPFTSATELLPLEVWGGVLADIGQSSGTITTGAVPPFNFNQRYLGTPSYLRNGRTNFGDFTLSTDDVTSRNISAATNTSPIQITTTTHGLTTGQTVTVSGVGGNTAANGTFKITVVNNTTFTLDGTAGNGSYTSGGTVRGCPRWLHLQNGIYLQWNGPSGLNA